MKLLLVDDDHTIHLTFTKPLTNSGFKVLSAYDGKEALRIANEQRPDLIILDLTLPKMDGREICKKLKCSAETREIKVIMLTAKGEQYDRLLGFEMGADEYIDKPCSIMFLERTINKILRK